MLFISSMSSLLCVCYVLGCSDKKDSEATAARLKGNRFYKAKRWDKALELYMNSLKARPYAVKTLANVAQVRQMLRFFPRSDTKAGEGVFHLQRQSAYTHEMWQGCP